MSSTHPTQPEPTDIAIVGLALRFPGAHGPEKFWSNLRAGVDSVRHFSDEELLARGVSARSLRDPAYVKAGLVLDGIDLFDAEFFGFSPKDAAIMDPQHRQFLECSWEALEDAGHMPGTFNGPIGVFAGCGMGSYFMFNLLSNPRLVDSVGMFLLRHTGNDKDFLTTRVSYCLDLKGPSVSIQTACSTSMVAVHSACQSLIAGECDMALAGGVTIELPHGVGYRYQDGEILSPDGHCRPFDRHAQGTIFGSGAGTVVLRRLDDALKDGDRIYAVIKGSAVNNDGAGKVSYLAPSVDGQAAVVAEAIANAGIDLHTIEYIEAHGTGTPMGDPIEVAALAQVFGRSSSRDASCGLGSVKANIGHLDTAAGVAGLIKVALALHHGEIPPTPNFEAPSPEMKLADTPFFVVDRLRPWPRGARPRRAGVTSLGVGGTNAHVVLEEAPLAVPSTKPARDWQVLCLSARNKRALDESAQRLAAHLRENPEQELADVAYTLLAGRRGFEQRRVVVGRSHAEAAALLEAGDAQRVFSHSAGNSPASVTLLLPGGGAQYHSMGRELYESEPEFRALIDRGVEGLLNLTGVDLRGLWNRGANAGRPAPELDRPSVQLPAIFILEYALAHFWMSLGIRPDALIGHSLGECTAACLAGVQTFEDTLGLIALRGELLESEPCRGAMLSVLLAPEDLSRWIDPSLDLAAINAPSISVASGRAAAIEKLEWRLAQAGVEAQRVPITIAAHSRQIEEVQPRYLERLRSMRMRPPRIPFISNLTGTWITAEQAVSPEYWVAQLRSTVRFADGIKTLLADPRRVLLEVGPGKALCSFVRQHPDASALRGVVASLRHAEEKVSDTAHFLTSFGRLWACGVALDPSVLWKNERRARVSLPSYPFQHRRYWIEPGKPLEVPAATAAEPRKVDLLTEGFYKPVWNERPLEAVPAAVDAGPWLLFLDSAGVGEQLAKRLRAQGGMVITVRESDDNRRLGEGDYALAPERGRQGYSELVRDLVSAGQVPRHIVHLWMLTHDECFRPGSNFFHRNQERGFYSLVFLAQALGEEGVKQPLHITVVGNSTQTLEGEEQHHPGKATINGPCKVIPREFPGVTCSIVDLPLPVSKTRINGRGLRPAVLESLVAAVEAEVLSPPRTAVVAYREKGRYEQEFEHTTLAPAGNNGHAPVRERGVYLITGGLGGIGLTVAEYMARQARARIVLTSRSYMPEPQEWDAWLAREPADDPTTRRIRAVRRIEAAGGEVLIARADVTDIEAMQDVLEQTQRRFGPLNGVVHAAGVLRDAPILAKSQEQVEEVFASKIHGTLVLDALLRDTDLDFLLLFSSLSAIVAPAGQVDYVAASAFLDAYAHGAAKTPRRRTISVNWGIWSGSGMAANALNDAGSETVHALGGRQPRHPMFDSRGGDPDAPLLLQSRYAARTHWLLDEHRTREGTAVVPGSAYLEMARAALLEAGESPVFEIRDLMLIRPLHVSGDEARDVQVELRADPEGYAFAVRSRPFPAEGSRGANGQGRKGSEGAWEVHAQARLLMRRPPAPARVPIEQIEARCVQQRAVSGQGFLRTKQAGLLRFGARWQTLQEVRLGPGEALATLELGSEFGSDLEHIGLHPALLDVATTCGLELPELKVESESGRELWVPLSYKRVRVHAPLGPRLRSWVKSHAANRAGAKVLSFDVVVFDQDGRVCLEIEEFAMRRLTGDHQLGAQKGRVQQPAPIPASRLPAQLGDRSSARPSSPGLTALQHNFERGIAPAEGMEALYRILAAPDLVQIVATSLDLPGLREQADSLGAQPDVLEALQARPQLDSEFVEPSDPIQRTLTGFWQELLGVQSLGVRDNFFDLGGHSLIAVRLFARIKKTYRIEFPISLLFEAPTIESCAEAIRKVLDANGGSPGEEATAIEEPRYTHLVPMHPGQGGDKTPFFLVAGMFGNVLNLRHLAHLLGNERRVLGLQALGLFGTHKPHETFEEMAADYLAEVRSVQPVGPYLLGGFSGGGITAYEMARQLVEAGEEVALLAMLDTSIPEAPHLGAGERARIHWERIRRRGPAYLGEWARDKLRFELARIRKLRHDSPIPSEFRSADIGAAFLRAIESYEMQHYPGTVSLFRPKLEVAHILGPGRMTNSRREFVFADNGWGPYVERVDVFEVPGNHDSMVLEPNVRVLAAKLRTCIQAAETKPNGVVTENSDVTGA